MKYICLGYIDEKKWDTMSESERNEFVDVCFTYDDVLKKNGHLVGGDALQGPRSAATLRYRNGKVSVTDGPFAETKEQLGGFMILEARDLDQAIQLMSLPAGRQGSTRQFAWEADPGRYGQLQTYRQWSRKASSGV